jgi:hypothetical protein
LLKHWIWKIKPQNIYVFSKTAAFDLTYRPVIRWLFDKIKEEGGVLNIYESIDMEKIKAVVEQ